MKCFNDDILYIMKIISWNTNGLRATVKQGYFMPLFSFNNPDIVCDKWSDTSSVEYIHQLKIYSIYVGDLPKNEAEEFIKKSIEKSIEKTPPKRKLLF